MMGKLNLTLQINALAAKQGLEPHISRSKYIKPIEADINELRQKKIKQHLFHLQKVLNRAFKKAKIFTVQRIVKKLKKAKEENKPEESIEAIEEQLVNIKAHKPLEQVVLDSFLSKCSEYAREKCSFIEAEEAECDEVAKKIMQNNAFNAELPKIASAFELFLKKLYHEGESPMLQVKKQHKKEKNPAFSKREHFVSSLGTSEKKRRNRAGQAARRKMAEEKYGDKAKHLQKQKPAVDKPKKRYYNTFVEEKEQKRGSEDLHPSWQARREEKEKLSKVKFQGQKITFDD